MLVFKIILFYNVASDHSSGIRVGKDLGHVQHLSFSLTDRLITACIGKEIWVLNIQVRCNMVDCRCTIILRMKIFTTNTHAEPCKCRDEVHFWVEG